MVFPNVYERCASVCETDRVVAIRGTVNFKEDEAPKILADEILDIDEAVEKGFSERKPFRRRETAGQPALSGASPALGQPVAGPERQPAGIIKLRISANMNEEMTLQQIKVNLARHKGDYQVLIYLPSGRTLRTDSSLWAEPSPALRNQLIALLGQENVKI